ncbi:hypothetical protein K437DRAFT_261489 [Tilletiaria anomala UBC 951]|uniref:Uncharacterized protein n=1 Tax=Tilletiaria anomala (strain ATCC 24038 / CBS 436.72 / UBC 951) TaxID=1037660 RepID=A0A066WNN9_TILAU|nr:uncharacterized protein K437DRAFT_261489 [Tilletiaria anomala UBC 951]KDN52230.1 hypothetical protein K437DRAFT_261489 [Tilletiaria anomala UBC 951]
MNIKLATLAPFLGVALEIAAIPAPASPPGASLGVSSVIIRPRTFKNGVTSSPEGGVLTSIHVVMCKQLLLTDSVAEEGQSQWKARRKGGGQVDLLQETPELSTLPVISPIPQWLSLTLNGRYFKANTDGAFSGRKRDHAAVQSGQASFSFIIFLTVSKNTGGSLAGTKLYAASFFFDKKGMTASGISILTSQQLFDLFTDDRHTGSKLLALFWHAEFQYGGSITSGQGIKASDGSYSTWVMEELTQGEGEVHVDIASMGLGY